MFEDPDFPADDTSLYLKPEVPDQAPCYVPNLQWLRPNEIVEVPEFFPDDKPPQVVQGMLGDCWFLSALSVVANRPRILRRLFRNNPGGPTLNQEGRYVLTFFYDQEWVDVEIDDRIPCREDKVPCFSRSRDRESMWVPLIEKAYAKLHGKCYEKLEGGVASQGLANICGTIGFKMYFADLFEELCVSEEKSRMISGGEVGLLEKDNDEHYEVLKDLSWRVFSVESAVGSLFATGKSDVESGIEEATDDGLLQNHAYGIMKFIEINGVRLVQMRNPWGKKEWTGRFSDKSDAWTPELQQEAGWKDANDGVFFMDWDDFHKEFPSVFAQTYRFDEEDADMVVDMADHNPWLMKYFERHGGARAFLAKERPEMFQLEFDLIGDSAGGCLNYMTWRNNPQMLINATAERDIPVVIQVCQKDMRYSGSAEYNESIGFMVVKGPEEFNPLKAASIPRLSYIPNKADIIYKSKFEYARFVTRKLTLPAYDGVYYVIGYMFHPTDDTKKFNINVIPLTPDPDDIEVSPVTRDYCYKLSGSLRGETAGGCPNFDTWTNNPQYVISPLLGDSYLSVVMVPDDLSKPQREITPQSMGVCLFEDKEKANQITKWKPPAGPMPDFAISRDHALPHVKLSGGQYILMPMAYKPEFEYDYEMLIYSSVPLRIANGNAQELWLHPDMTKNMAAMNNLTKFATDMIQDAASTEELNSKIQEHFKSYDLNGNGLIEWSEFEGALDNFSNSSLSSEDIRRVFDLMDINSSNSIDYQEFAGAVTNSVSV